MVPCVVVYGAAGSAGVDVRRRMTPNGAERHRNEVQRATHISTHPSWMRRTVDVRSSARQRRMFNYGIRIRFELTLTVICLRYVTVAPTHDRQGEQNEILI